MTGTIAKLAALLMLSGTALAQEPAGTTAGAAGAPAAEASQPRADAAAGTSTAANLSTEPAAAPPGERVAATAGADAPPDADRDAEPADTAPAVPGGPRNLSGMSILGNQEAPTSLVIVPWKSSEIGDGIGVSRALDPGIGPVDRDVFMRELRYYEIRTGAAD